MDVTDIHRIARLWRVHGDRFATRWFTTDELVESARESEKGVALSLRFAAKEAVWKSLGQVGRTVPWHSIAIVDLGSQPRVLLSGDVAAAATAAGVVAVQVRVMRFDRMALAVAISETH